MTLRPYARLLCKPMHGVLLPRGLATGLSLTDAGGKLAIDGTVTAIARPEREPVAYALADGRVLLDIADSPDELVLWDPATRTATSLGRGRLTPASTFGFLVQTHPEPGTDAFSGIDPRAPRLRELYRTAGSMAVVGTLDGAIAILDRKNHATADADLVCLSAPGEITRTPIDVPVSMHVAGDNEIRDHRLLLVGEITVDTAASWARTPFEVPVEILDLDTRARRRIGNLRGRYTEYTNMPHPYAQVVWSDVDVPRFVAPEGQNPTRVDVATEVLR